MSQDFTAQTDSTADKGGFSTTTGYATGTICPATGTYRASNKYLDIILAVEVGEIFHPGPDGKKTTWYALAPTLSSNQDGGLDWKSTRLNSSHIPLSRMPSSA